MNVEEKSLTIVRNSLSIEIIYLSICQKEFVCLGSGVGVHEKSISA